MRFDVFKILILFFIAVCCLRFTQKDLGEYDKKQVQKIVPSSLLGEWVSIKDYILPITGLGDQEISDLMSINCKFGNDICIIFKDTVYNPVYGIKRVNAAQYFLDNYPNISKGLVEIKKDSIDIVTVSSAKVTSSYDVLEVDDKLLIFSDGVFFQYQRPEGLDKSNPILVREFDFQGNAAVLRNPLNVVDSLRSIAKSLNINKRLFVIVQGNTDNKGLESKTTIDNKDGSIRDLLIARAQSVSQILITQLKVNSSQVRTSIGRINYRRSATVMLFRH